MAAVSFITLMFVAPAQAGVTPVTSVIYATTTNGSNAVSDLYVIDPQSGASAFVGSTGFQRISGIEIAVDGVLYGTAERNDGWDTPVLIAIDKATGLGTEVGPTGLSGAVADLAFRGDGTLFAYDATADHRLATIDTSTGAATVLGFTGISADGGNGIEFSGGVLHHISRVDGLHTLDQTTGAASSGTPVTFVGGESTVLAMDSDPGSGVTYAVVDSPISNPARRLATVNFGTATVTSYVDTVDQLDAITLPEPAPSAVLLWSLGFVAMGCRRADRRS